MRDGLRTGLVLRLAQATIVAATIAASVLLGGCSGMSNALLGATDEPRMAQAAATGQSQSDPSASELEMATEYWGKQHAKSPRDGDAALNYAKNLKALGRKKEALTVLQQVHLYNTQNREHLSEYGRLALEFGQISTAKQLLERADDPAKPDWRVISARGTVLAKEGRYKEAVAFFERARDLAPGQASVLNNLAMAYAMDGEAAKAEGLLRQAAEATGSDGRVRQNLALVLGLQGKYREAKDVAGKDLAEESAESNIDMLRRIVRAEPKAEAPSKGTPVDTEEAPKSTAQADSGKSRRASSGVATSSIDRNDPDQLIEAAIRAEVAKSR